MFPHEMEILNYLSPRLFLFAIKYFTRAQEHGSDYFLQPTIFPQWKPI